MLSNGASSVGHRLDKADLVSLEHIWLSIFLTDAVDVELAVAAGAANR